MPLRNNPRCTEIRKREKTRLAINLPDDEFPGRSLSNCQSGRSPSVPSFPLPERTAVDQSAAGMAPQDRRKLSILASTDETSNHSLSNCAICVRMLEAFVAMSRSRPVSNSPVHSVRRLLLVPIASDQTRDGD